MINQLIRSFPNLDFLFTKEAIEGKDEHELFKMAKDYIKMMVDAKLNDKDTPLRIVYFLNKLLKEGTIDKEEYYNTLFELNCCRYSLSKYIMYKSTTVSEYINGICDLIIDVFDSNLEQTKKETIINNAVIDITNSSYTHYDGRDEDFIFVSIIFMVAYSAFYDREDIKNLQSIQSLFKEFSYEKISGRVMYLINGDYSVYSKPNSVIYYLHKIDKEIFINFLESIEEEDCPNINKAIELTKQNNCSLFSD